MGVITTRFEPEGLSCPDEVIAQRLNHLAQVRALFNGTEVFIFTLGLTEAWAHRASGTVYPTCPGVVAGEFDPETYLFCGAMAQRFDDVDYFPSYELVVSPFTRGSFFESNLRSVTADGVESVMRVFLAAHGFDRPPDDTLGPITGKAPSVALESTKAEELICEEELLEAFRP